MAAVVAGVPVKPFQAAKQRLAAVLAPDLRVALSQGLAQRTCQTLVAAGAETVVLAADEDVADWADGLGFEAVLDQGFDLNQAAAAALQSLRKDRSWLICHADLPLLNDAALAPVMAALASGRPVIAPSRDGGTTLLGGSLRRFRFSYGPGSFHGHLRSLAPHDPRIVVDARLAIDLDEPSDLEAARRVPWIAAMLDTLGRS